MTAEVGDRIRSSVKITLVATVLSGIIQAATMVVLARLLEPQDYGFYVVCLSINALSTAFLMSVVERAMVIEGDGFAPSGRSLPLMLGLLLISLTALAICALIKTLTGWAIDLRILAIVLAVQAISGIAIVPRARLRKQLQFGRIVTGEVIGQVLGNFLTAAVLASLGFGSFALATGFAVGFATSTLWMLAGTGIFAKFGGCRTDGFGPLARTVGGVIRPASVEALNGQISPLVVSSLLGAVSLGLFNRVYTIVTLPVQLMISSLNRVLISALVTVSDDLERRRRGAQMMLRMAAALVTPLTFGVAGSSHAFVATVLGPKWTSAAAIVPFLAIAVWGNMIGALLGQLAESVRRFNDKTRVQAIATTILVGAMIVGAHWGMIGIAAGAMVAGLALAMLYVRLAADILETPARTIIRWFVPSWIAGIAAAASATLVGYLLPGKEPPIVLAAQVAACGGAAALSYALIDRALVMEISRMLLPSRVDAIVRRLLPVTERSR